MKAFKRISAIVISLAMIMSCAFSSVTFAAADFNDVADNNQYYKAIYDLVDKGIINGYDNGDGSFSFKPDGNITRAEFAKMIAVADAPSTYSFAASTSSFTDVAAEHWAVGYIEYAVNRKIINGMGDGTFAPDAPVTYAQALKMIVCALNYGFAAEATTPWYQTYITLANQLNLTKNAMGMPDNAAARGLIAQLIYNMNGTAPAVQTGTDADGNPTYSAGTTTKEQDSKGTDTFEGILLGVFNETITGQSEGLNKKEALVVDDDDEEIFLIGQYSVEDIAEYLGYEVKITYSEDNSGDYVIEKISKTSTNKTYTISDIDISDISESKVEYFDEDSRNGVDSVKISDDMYVLKNGGSIDMDDLVEELAIDCGELFFIDNDGNGVMDVAFIKSYETMFVGSVANSNGKYTVHDKFASRDPFVFYEDNEDITVKVLNNGSKSLTDGTLSSIASSNVISVAVSASDANDIEIIVSKQTASGSSSQSEVKSISGDYLTIKLGNETFDVSNYYLSNLDSTSFPQELSVGDKCNVYLDFTGKIAAVNKKETSTSYGYIVKVGTKSGSNMDDDNYLVRMYDVTGKLYSELPVADKGFRINGSSADGADLKDAVETAAETVNADKDESQIVNASQATLVKYEISNGKLKSVYLLNEGIEGKYISDGSTLTYNSSSNSFRSGSSTKFTISASTKVFIVPKDRSDNDYRITTGTSYFANSTAYVIDAYDADGNLPAKAVVVYGVNTAIKPSTDTVLVTNITDALDDDNEPVKELTYIKLGSTEKETIKSKDYDTFDGVGKGDAIKLLVVGGKVERIQHIFSVEDELVDPAGYANEDEGYRGPFEIGDSSYNEDTGLLKHYLSGNSDYFAIYGTVTLRPGDTEGAGGENINISIDGDDENSVAFKISDSTAIIKCVADAGDRGDLFEFDKVADDIIDVNIDAEDASKVLVIRYGTGVVKAIIIYK